MGGGNECLEQALWNKKVLLFGGRMECGVQMCLEMGRWEVASLTGTHK